MRTRFAIGLTLIASLHVTAHVHAQGCLHGWAAGPLLPDLRGANGQVRALWMYDPPGTFPATLIVAGDFTQIGNIPARHVASWDGSVWRPLGEGTDGRVLALTTYNNNLIVAGDFNEAGGLGPFSRYVAAWNGSDWFMLSNIPLGYVEPVNDPSRYVSTLAVYGGQLFVGGKIRVAPTEDSHIFRLNGNTWEDVDLPDFNREPQILVNFDEDGAGPVIPLLYTDVGHALYNGGIWRWNGTGWFYLEPHPKRMRATTITNDGLVAGGEFTSIYLGDGDWQENVFRIAVWDGSDWHPYGGGIGGSRPEDPIETRVTSVRQYGNDLYAAGRFSVASGQTCFNMARWNGSFWLGAGVLFSGNGYRDVHEMRVFDGKLIVGGDFNLVDNFGEVNHLAVFDGFMWTAVTTNTSINALATIGASRLVIGGDFTHVDSDAGTPNPSYIATWNGLDTLPLSAGVNAPVHALKSFSAGNNYLIVGGEFTLVGSDPGSDPGFFGGSAIPANRIAKWSDALLNGGWSAMGNGFNNTVLAVDYVPANQFLADMIVAGGEFTASGTGSPAFNRIATWSGSSGPWASVGSGFNNRVRAIKAFNTSSINRVIYAGGDFTTADGESANRIAYWPIFNLNGWEPMGSGFNNSVYAIERHNGFIYAGGAFTHSGTTQVNRIAQWTGTAWVPVGTGAGFSATVRSLRSVGSYLYASGDFTAVDGLGVNHVARWDGTSWTSVDGGVNGAGKAILPFKTELIVGGDFTKAQSNTVSTSGLARYRDTGLPWIVRQPLAQTASCPFDIAEFEVDVATGYQGLVNYRWHKDGVPLSDGWTGTGSYLIGTDGTYLQIRDPSDADEGAYHLVITNACGTVTSTAVSLTVTGTCPPCPRDIAPPLVGNGVVDIDDLVMVITSWGNCTVAPPACRADVAPPGGNGVVNIDDLVVVITGWGACP